MTQTPRVDLFDFGFKANPYPICARLRSEASVHRVALFDRRCAWLIARYEDVSAARRAYAGLLTSVSLLVLLR